MQALSLSSLTTSPAVQAAQYIANGAARSTVKSITLKNMELTEDLLVKMIKRLQTTGGTLKVKGDLLTAKVKAELVAKGWTGSPL